MELKLLTREQLRTVYASDLARAFPPEELKPLEMMETLRSQDRYQPFGLFSGGDVAGECLLWLGQPGWALLDYLCVPPDRRNGGLGGTLLQMMLAAEPGRTVFLEAEDPAGAEDPVMARRRLGFYRRSGARTAPFQTEVFGVPYRLLYWADKPVSDRELMERYDGVYRGAFSAKIFQTYIRVPRDPAHPTPRVPWMMGDLPAAEK